MLGGDYSPLIYRFNRSLDLCLLFGTLPAKTHRTKHPLKNPNEIHQFTNSQIYKEITD